ncbi:MAG: ChaN family lipoprotein, partial [Bacteroidota bacterium]
MKKITFILFLLAFGIYTIAQNKKAYQIFNPQGEKVNYEQLLQTANKSDIILFGELHNNPIAHWLQYEVSYDLIQNGKLTFGAEMFEADN